MKLLRILSNDQVFRIALGIAVAVICYISSIFYARMQRLDDSVALIAQSGKVQLELEKILSTVSNYETYLRSYIITKDKQYVASRFLDRGEINRGFERLDVLGKNRPQLRKDLDSLRHLATRRLDIFQQTLLYAKTPGSPVNELNELLLRGTSVTNDMRALVSHIVSREARQLQQLHDAHGYQLKDSSVSAFLLILLSLTILLMSFNRMNHDIRTLRQKNDQLQFLNYTFNNAEKAAGFGHWKMNLDKGTNFFSDNFYRMLGIEPQSEAASPELVSRFMHPEDFAHVMAIHEETLRTHEPTSHLIRFILADGTTKYVHSVSSFMHNSSGETIKVGANFDVTEQQLKNAALEQSNRELRIMNEELESFNNIVSHDLQEPLRKIQMFISRIEERESETISGPALEYFVKIKATANRMQALMIDLVNYTRTLKGEKVYFKTRFNAMLDQVLEDLSADIEDKKAVIIQGELPTVRAISFQIEQLFTNLISNALKYSKADVAPQISVTSEKIEKGEMAGNALVSDRDYHKIVVSDNGIGFKQEYADRIFVLFQRLETDSKYSGTGIGLAICKKIMENHHGFITVYSKPGLGTTFNLYFPKNQNA